MNKSRFFVLALLVCAICLVPAASYATVHIWNVGVRAGSAGSGLYTELAPDAAAGNYIYGLDAAGVSRMYKSGATWDTSLMASGSFSAICGDAAGGNNFYAASATGVDLWVWDGSAFANAGSASTTGGYKDMAPDASVGYDVYALRDGGVDQLYYNGTSWGTTNMISGTFSAVAGDATHVNHFYVASATGVDLYTHTGSWTLAGQVSATGSYTALATDATEGYTIYGLRDGAVDKISYNPSSGWATTTIISGDYISIAADGTISGRLYLSSDAAAGPAHEPGVFSTIDFEVSEGYPAPQAFTAGVALKNIADGPDFKDCNYNTNPSAMGVWNGVSNDPGGWPPMPVANLGVPSGNSAFIYYGCWNWNYARTPTWSPRPVAPQLQDDRYFTIDYNSLVLYSAPESGNEQVPPEIVFWFNGFGQNSITINHSKALDPAGTKNIWLSVNGTSYNVGSYRYQEWATEKLVVDKLLNSVSYYYNDVLAGTYPIAPIAKWQNYGVDIHFGNRDGAIAVDNIRFGTKDTNVFSIIDFEESEGYPAPQSYSGVGQRNIGSGPDFTDYHYGAGVDPTAMFAWDGENGVWGVPSGRSAFFYDAAWQWTYARVPGGAVRTVPADRQNDRYFTIDFSSNVGYAITGPDDMIPAKMLFWFNGFENNYIQIEHSKVGDAAGTKTIYVTAQNGASYDIHSAGDYTADPNHGVQPWSGERLVLDKQLDQATYYYNGEARVTFPIQHIESWQNYGLNYYTGNRSGWIATDNLRFGTQKDLSLLPKIGYSDNIMVDGDLSEWNGATWVQMSESYDSLPFAIDGGDISSASYAVKWGAGGTRVYVAVKVDDVHHKFTGNYAGWSKRDAIELYLHTVGTEGDYVHYQEPAQEWSVGLKNSNEVWKTVGFPVDYDYAAPYNRGDYVPTNEELVAQGREVGTQLRYEVAMTPYAYFASRWNLDHPTDQKTSNVSPLSAGQIVGFGVVAVTNDGTTGGMPYGYGDPGYWGMATDLVTGQMSAVYTVFPERLLVRNGVKGRITLAGHTGSLLGESATIKVYNGSTLIETHNVVLDSVGTYSFENALNSSYTLVASAPDYLTDTKSVSIASSEAAADFILTKATAVSLPDAKKQADGTVISVSGSVTAVFSDYFYIESADRESGIRVKKAGHGLTVSNLGKVVNAAGPLKRDSSTEECYIDALAVDLTSSTVTILPLGLTNKAMAGGDFIDAVTGYGQAGASDGTGLNNIGLLVRTTGLASGGNADGFIIDDGSGVLLRVALPGAGTAYDGEYVTVTGISSLAAGRVRVLLTRSASDVAIVAP